MQRWKDFVILVMVLKRKQLGQHFGEPPTENYEKIEFGSE